MNAPLEASLTARQLDKPRREANKLAKRLRRNAGQAIVDFNMIAEGNRVMVCLSGGKLKAMPPKLVTDDGRHMVIRPLAYCTEKDLAAWAEERRFPIIPCDLCGSQDQLQRKQVKRMPRE